MSSIYIRTLNNVERATAMIWLRGTTFSLHFGAARQASQSGHRVLWSDAKKVERATRGKRRYANINRHSAKYLSR